jgi:hypothetical protein
VLRDTPKCATSNHWAPSKAKYFEDPQLKI